MPLRLRRSNPLFGLLLSALPAVSALAQWSPVISPTDVELRGLSVVSSNVVWASGQRGTVVRTTDGGRSWSSHTLPGASGLDLRAVAATSARVAHAISIGDSSRIYRTMDGGRTWTLRWSATRKGTFLDAIRFWDARHGIAMSDPVDGRFLILTTSDGGDSWQETGVDRIPPALEGEGGFAASGSCLTVFGSSHVWFGSGGARTARVYRSSDRGRSWTVHETPLRAGTASAGIFSVVFRDVRNGVIAGGDYQHPALRGRNLARTSDGGRTWRLVDSLGAPAGYRSAVAYLPDAAGRLLVAVGLSGTDLSRDAGRSWQLVDSTAYNSIGFSSANRGWAVGPRGRIARWMPAVR